MNLVLMTGDDVSDSWIVPPLSRSHCHAHTQRIGEEELVQLDGTA